MENTKLLLKKLIKQKAIKKGNFVLSSGKTTDFYIDGKQITLHPDGAYYTAKIILQKINGLNVQHIGGLTIGADPIAIAVSLLSRDTDSPVTAFIVRKEQKAHGLQKEIEGIITPNSNVVIVDDVITTASSTLTAIKAVEKIGCKVVKVVCLVDRQEGGAEALQGYEFDPIFTKEELLS